MWRKSRAACQFRTALHSLVLHLLLLIYLSVAESMAFIQPSVTFNNVASAQVRPIKLLTRVTINDDDPRQRRRRPPERIRKGQDDDFLDEYDSSEAEALEDTGEYQRLRPPVLDLKRPRRRPEVRKNKLPLGIPFIPQGLSAALLAGTFVLGIALGVTVDSAVNTNPRDLASRDAIDKNAPNPKFCQRYGASSLVMDNRAFVTFNPFAIYVTQADVKPGCVLRAANVRQTLYRRGLLSDAEIQSCKNAANTWAYVGDVNDKPQLSCVYQSDDSLNEFLSDPKKGIGVDVYDDNSTIDMMRKQRQQAVPPADPTR